MTEQIAGIDVSRETFERLEQFQALVLKWTDKINLIAPATKSEIWHRHIEDSAQVWHAAPSGWTRWVDMGAGGGFPGIVLAILAKEKSPESQMVLIESDQRKSTFLRTAARELDLNVKVLSERIEKVEPLAADVVSARALASLDMLLGFAQLHLSEQGLALFQKGKNAEQEIAEAKANWAFETTPHRSITDPQSMLLAIKEIKRV